MVRISVLSVPATAPPVLGSTAPTRLPVMSVQFNPALMLWYTREPRSTYTVCQLSSSRTIWLIAPVPGGVRSAGSANVVPNSPRTNNWPVEVPT